MGRTDDRRSQVTNTTSRPTPYIDDPDRGLALHMDYGLLLPPGPGVVTLSREIPVPWRGFLVELSPPTLASLVSILSFESRGQPVFAAYGPVPVGIFAPLSLVSVPLVGAPGEVTISLVNESSEDASLRLWICPRKEEAWCRRCGESLVTCACALLGGAAAGK